MSAWPADLQPILSFMWRLAVFVSLQGFVVRFLVTRFTRHSLALWGRLDRNGSAIVHRFVIQNNEDVPFLGPGVVRISLEGRSASFDGEPRVFAGCKALKSEMNDRRNEWSLHFDALPPYDSWTITCRTVAQHDVTLTVTGGDSSPTHSTITLNGVDSSVLVGTDLSPDPLLAGLVILLGECAYFMPVLFGWPYPVFHWIDALVGVGLAAFGAVVFQLVSQRPQPVVQGYSKPSVVDTLEKTRVTGAVTPPA